MAGPTIDVIMTRDHVVLKNGAYSLWCGRKDGKLMPGREVEPAGLDLPVPLGQVWGCIGKIRFFSDADWKLLLIRHASSVGEIPRGGKIYCIEQIAVLPLTTDPSVEHVGLEPPSTSDPGGLRPHSPALGKSRSTRTSKDKSRELKDKEKLERRLTEALLWMFNESRSFYFCPEGDLTQSLQRQPAETEVPLWLRVDERFFWNKRMLDDLLEENYAGTLADPWVLPVVQGYVEIREIPVQRQEMPDTLQAWKPLQEVERRTRNPDLLSRLDTAESWGTYEMVEIPEGRASAEMVDSLEQAVSGRNDATEGERGGATSTNQVEELDGYESDSESSMSKDTDDRLDDYYGRLYTNQQWIRGEEGEQTREEGGAREEAREGEQMREEGGVREEAREEEQTREEGGAREEAREGEQTKEEGGAREEAREGEQAKEEGRVKKEEMTLEGGAEGRRRTAGVDDENSGDEAGKGAVVCEQRRTSGELGDGGSKGVLAVEEEMKESVQLGDDGSEGAVILGQGYGSELGVDTRPTDGEYLDHGSRLNDQTSRPISAEQHVQSSNAEPAAVELATSSSVQEHHQDHNYHENQDQDLNEAITGGTASTLDLSLAPEENSQQYEVAALEEESHDTSTGVTEMDALVPVVDNSRMSGREGLIALDGSDVPGDEDELAALSGDEDTKFDSGLDENRAVEERPTALDRSQEGAVEEVTVDGPEVGGEKEVTDFGSRQDDSVSSSEEGGEEPEDTPTFTLVLVSRRSRHRAGTRYLRRGVDREGHVANYVETEMLILSGAHQVSYVIVRGSVPIYWTQLGYKYRPPAVIEKGEEETQEAFRNHFDQQLDLYKKMAIVNLVNQTGREGVIAEAYEKHILLLDYPLLTYVTFDFHQQYKLHGAVPLLSATEDIVKRQKFCWLNTELEETPLCTQGGVFRVNCMDCLDRTNVIQSLFCKQVLQTTLHKLGVLPFEEKLGESTLRHYQEMWANNGDILSRQYTGTRAMKGDLTRYGERKFYGIMKDGYNSAHRYYQNAFRDAYRQVLIDLMQGYTPSQAFGSLPPSMRMLDEDIPVSPITANEVDASELWSLDREQLIADMIQQCKHQLFNNKHLHIQGWAVMEAAGYSFLESSQKEEECVLLQCREKSQLCIANYNSEIDQVVCFIRIPMEKIQKIVVGSLGTLLRSSKRLHMRIYYSLVEDRTCYFTFKTVNFTSIEDDKAILMGIANALSYIQPSITVHEQKLTKKRSPDHEGVAYLIMPEEWKAWTELDQQDEDSKTALSQETGSSGTGKKPERLKEDEGDQTEQDLEDEPEISFSAPSSPKLGRRVPQQLHKRTRSQSFDDILSSINNEVIPPAASKSQTVPRSPERARKSSVLQLPCDSDSGSESDVETYELSTTASESGLRGSQKQLEDSTESGHHPQTSAFTRFKGRFLQKIRFAAQKQLQQLSSAAQETEDSDAQTVTQKLKNSPGLLRKVGVSRSPQPPQLSEEDRKREEAREKSQTKFLLT